MPRSTTPATLRNWYVAAGGLVLCYAGFFASLRSLPFEDLPNHVTRSAVIASILRNGTHVRDFIFEPMWVPYILGDLFLSVFVLAFGVLTGGALWMAFIFLLFVGSLVVYLRARGASPDLTVTALLCAPYWGTSYFLLCGFTNYSLSCGLVFITLALWEAWKRNPRHSLFGVGTFLGIAVCYFTHLAGFTLIAVVLAASVTRAWFQQEVSFLRACSLAVAIAGFGALYVTYSAPEGSNTWGPPPSPLTKLLTLCSIFFRYDYVVDGALLGAFALIVFLLLFRRADSGRGDDIAEYAWMTCALGVVFLLFPQDAVSSSNVDSRLVPFLIIFYFLYVCGRAGPLVISRSVVRVTFFALAIANFIYLASFLVPINAFHTVFLAAIERIPPGQYVLPVSTLKPIGRLQPTTHLGELYTVKGPGVAADIFSENNAGRQLAYFSYRERLYMPDPFWYTRDLDVLWDRVASTYDCFAITKPFDDSKIRVAHLETIFQNEAATVLCNPHVTRTQRNE